MSVYRIRWSPGFHIFMLILNIIQIYLQMKMHSLLKGRDALFKQKRLVAAYEYDYVIFQSY